jgi:acyl-CoA thioesterase FadM
VEASSAVGAACGVATASAAVASPVPGAGTAESIQLADGRPAVRMHFRAQSYDIDFAQHMNNIADLRWCEDLRLALLDLALPLPVPEQGICPVVAETSIRYRRPIKLFDIVVGTQFVSETDERYFTTTTELYKGDELAALSVQKLCIVDTATGKAIPLPEMFRALGEPPGSASEILPRMRYRRRDKLVLEPW